VRATCKKCGSEIAASLLSCPNCHSLVYAERLSEVAVAAEKAQHEERLGDALGQWREALTLLPRGSKQYLAIEAKCAELSKQADAAGPARSKSLIGKSLAGLGGVGLLIWKFKAVAFIVASKAKFLLLGLTKGGTILSMAASLGVYWVAFGWVFALGLVVSIYIHEMGHVAALNRYGIKATAPMFIPGFGAVIRLKQYPTSPREDARVGLAGPVWGLAAALACYAVYWATGSLAWGAIGQLGAWINLFNLIPVWQLDGSRGFRALDRGQRWILCGIVVVACLLTGEGLLIIIAAVAAFRAYSGGAETPDWGALATFAGLIIVLSLLATIDLPMPLQTPSA